MTNEYTANRTEQNRTEQTVGYSRLPSRNALSLIDCV